MRRVSKSQRLNPRCPIDWQHTLNLGLVYEPAINAPLPSWIGGRTLYDLVRGARRPNDGALIGGVTWTSWQEGTALKFDGSTGYVQAGIGSLGNVSTAPFTIASFACTTTLAATEWTITLEGVGGDVCMGLRPATTGNWRVEGFGGGSSPNLDSGVAAVAGKWTFLAYTWDGTTSRIYVDGAFASSNITPPQSFTPVSVFLGTFDTGAFDRWSGFISSGHVFNCALSASKIAALYEQVRRGNPERWSWLPQAMYPGGAAAPGAFNAGWAGQATRIVGGAF